MPTSHITSTWKALFNQDVRNDRCMGKFEGRTCSSSTRDSSQGVGHWTKLEETNDPHIMRLIGLALEGEYDFNQTHKLV